MMLNRYKFGASEQVYVGMPFPDKSSSGVILVWLDRIVSGPPSPVATIWWGPKGENGRSSRQYEFRLRLDAPTHDWCVCFLYVKGEANHFKSKVTSERIVHRGHTQEVPLTYTVLAQMTEEEKRIILQDFKLNFAFKRQCAK